ncbi:hypothetical protein K438DRAFT_1987259 [Mycena galopus ATCC 62051]|nr:hypothetical protein K438DRAFT_1987259 [Mycena galopus ATCC 62051]
MPKSLHTFPPEILSEIFAVAEVGDKTTYPGAVVLSHVCHQWREAALGDSALWLEIGLCHRDVHHLPIITQFFQRSKGRKISIGMDLGDRRRPENPALFRALLRLVRAHLWRACHLFIYAQWETWQTITVAFNNQAYPNLSLLDLQLITPRAVQPSRWAQILGDGMSEPVAPLPPVVFSVPQDHPVLDRLRIIGITLANPPLPNLALIRIGGTATPNLVGSDGRVNRWFLDGPQSLYFEDMQIPPMPVYVAQPIGERNISTVTHLALSGLSASPRAAPGEDGLLEHSCIPFFDSLYTPRVRCLEIDRWDLDGRSWTDFFAWLPENIRFPYVVDMRITGMHFEDMDYADVAFFLGSFPRMRHLRLQDCWPGTWEVALEALQMDETLCPKLKSIRLNDDLAILRNDPLPFGRDHVDAER